MVVEQEARIVTNLIKHHLKVLSVPLLHLICPVLTIQKGFYKYSISENIISDGKKCIIISKSFPISNIYFISY